MVNVTDINPTENILLLISSSRKQNKRRLVPVLFQMLVVEGESRASNWTRLIKHV